MRDTVIERLANGASFERLVELRRWFHQHAELSFQEVETAKRIVEELERIGIPYEYDGPGTGIIARMHISDDAPTVALRAEMDALPGRETTGAEYTSIYENAMHACGHGAHMAIVLGAAECLQEKPPAGNVVFVFQPAEEKGAGSKTMIAAGALDGVQAIFAGHVTQEYPVGRIMIADGMVSAQSDRFSIQICGEGGHAARPHEATDAIVIAGFLIVAIQTLVSREVNPMHPSVVTIGSVHGGTAPNVIAQEASMEGSIRTTREDVRRHIHDGIRRMAEAAGLLHKAKVSVDIQDGYPPVVNSVPEASVARDTARQIFGDGCLVEMEHPSMGSEDFSYYLHQISGCFVRFGARHADWDPVPLHSPGFDIDERVLAVGARFFDQLARNFLETRTTTGP